MDFQDSPEEAVFRAEVRDWIEAHVAPYDLDRAKPATLDEEIALGRRWQALKAARGFAKITWPAGVGGIGGTPLQQIIFAQEEGRYRLPTGFFAISLGMPIPMMRRFATQAQQQRYLAPGLAGEEIWCQLFSEPAAGSDLAGVRLRAERVEQGWRLNGQKIWTSWAQIADFGLLLARSDRSVPKHQGLTAFFVDMRLPGIDVRPIDQISGGREFNEVFFTDVIIPDECRLSLPGGGWSVAIATLMEERFSVADPTGGGPELLQALKYLTELAEVDDEDAETLRAVARWYAIENGLAATRMRALTALSRGELPGPEGSLGKLVIARKLQETSAFVIDRLGPAGLLIDGDAGWPNSFQQCWLGSAGYRIAGGTDEILRNTIAERVLGLPAGPRADAGKPFAEL